MDDIINLSAEDGGRSAARTPMTRPASEARPASETTCIAGAENEESFANHAESIGTRLEGKTFCVGVLGLGYVGLPLAEAFISAGLPVIAYDIDQKKIDALRAGRSYIRHITAERVGAMNATKRLLVTTAGDSLRSADAILLCVPTPINAHREPDLSAVIGTAEMIAKILLPGQLVVLESTTYPGTTDEIIRPILENGSGLKAGVDFGLAYSPEREDPGNLDFCTTSIPKVVGANSVAELNAATALYSTITQTVPVKDMRTAEAVKLLENIYRLINISMINELKAVFSGMNIDIWDVIEAAKTKPFGFMAFHPGPGIGGHCIPIDPFYLTWKARAYGLSTRMIDLAGEINAALPRSVVEATAEALDERMHKPLSGSKLLIVGIAYKRNVDDLRETPALPIMQHFLRRGANLAYHDPHIASAADAHTDDPRITGMRSIPWTAEALSDFDCAVIVTDHADIDYELLLKTTRVVVDTRNATAKLWDRYRHKIVKA